MASAITKESQYSLKANAVRAKRYQRVIPSLGNNPNNGYAMGDTIIFYLPGGLRNQVMDGQTAYLRFVSRMTITAGAGNVALNAQSTAFDYTGSSIIRRLDIYGSGGSLVESIDNYNCLANVLYDVSYTQSDLKGLSTMLGCNGGDTTNATNRVGVTMLNNAQVNAGLTSTFDFVFSIPILSSLFQLSEKYIPIYALGDDIRVEIVLDSQARAFVIPTVANSTVTMTILSPEIIVDYLEMEPSAIAQIQSMYAGQDLVLHATSYHNYQTTIVNGTAGNFNTILPAKLISAKSALVTFRRLGTTGVQAGYSQSSRTNPFTGARSDFCLQIGGMRVPQRPITANREFDISEFFCELQKAFHALGDTRFSGCLPLTTYMSDETVVLADLPNARGFVVGINLDTLVRQTDVILSGMDLSKVTTYLEGTFNAAIVGDQTVDTFIHHDILLLVDSNGTMTSRS